MESGSRNQEFRQPLSGPVDLSQHPPCANQLLDRGGWRNLLAGVGAFFMGGPVDVLDAGCAQPGQTQGVLCQFCATEDRFGFGRAGHNRILTDSLFVR